MDLAESKKQAWGDSDVERVALTMFNVQWRELIWCQDGDRVVIVV